MTLNLALFILLLFLAFTCGAAIGWLVTSSRTRTAAATQQIDLAHTRQSLDTALAELASTREELSRLRDIGSQHAEQSQFFEGKSQELDRRVTDLQKRSDDDQSVLNALTPIARKLEEVDRYVRALESTSIERFTKIDKQLTDEAVVSAQLAHTTRSLSDALHHSSIRGSWGEVQLRRVVELAGMLERVDFDAQKENSHFVEQPLSGSRNSSKGRPDVTIHLPNNAHIAIDAKVPMTAYLQAHDISPHETDRANERHRLLEDHAKAVRNHIQTLKKRDYPSDFPNSPQLTIMFLPSEALLSEALDASPTILEDALASGIILVSPASLLALLRSIAAVWSSAQTTEEARSIVQTGRELVERLTVFVKHLNNLGEGLAKSVKAYNDAVGSLESRVLVTLRKFDSLGDKAATLGTTIAPLESDKASIRTVSRPELNTMGDAE